MTRSRKSWAFRSFDAFCCFTAAILVRCRSPMALLMTYIAAPGLNGADMVSERVLDTLLGAAIGIVFSVLFSTQDDRVYLAEHHIKRTQR